MKRSRTLLTTALPVALVAALALTGCAGSAEDPALAEQDCTVPGAASDAAKIAGEFGGEVTLEGTTPLTAKTAERTVAIEGDGDVIAKGASATAQLTVFNGKSGEVIAPGASATIINDAEQLAPWAANAIACSSIGDRVVLAAPVSDVLGAGGGESYDMADTDAIIAVMDFMKILPTRAEGTAVTPPAGFPTVELDESGKPTVTMPKGDAPKKLEIATLIEGDGATVKSGDTVTVHYIGAIWRTGEVFNSSWDMGQPASFPVTYPDGVIKGFYDALEGAKVGSQVMAVVPAADGYGENTAEQLKGSASDVKNDDVLVFVIDVLDTTSPQK